MSFYRGKNRYEAFFFNITTEFISRTTDFTAKVSHNDRYSIFSNRHQLG